MLIIGMTGPIGHGKTTFARGLEKIVPETIHLESSLVIAEVVNALHAKTTKLPERDNLDSINEWLKPLPEILLQVVKAHCSFAQIQLQAFEIERHPIEFGKLFLHIENMTRNPELARTEIDVDNKERYRPILQWIGGYLVKKVDSGIWYKELVRRAHNAEIAGNKICVIGGLRFPSDATILKQAGGVIVKVYRPGHLQYDMLDPTERERDNIPVDTTIVSDGSVEDMERCAAQVWQDIQTHSLQRTYRSSAHAE
jgi:hypothetical protein